MDGDGSFRVPDGSEQFGGGYDLAGVALRVVGEMDEQTYDAGGQLLFADAAGLVEVGSGEGANALGSGFETCVEFGEELVARGSGVGFGLHGSNLFGRELITFCVGEQAVEAARDVAQMEGEGRESEG